MPKFRQTMEVQLAWLDSEEKPAPAAPSSKRGPPRLPGVPAIPPMPVPSTSVAPKRRNTIDVEMDWVELVEEAKKAPKEEPKRTSAKPASSAPANTPNVAPYRAAVLPPAETTKPRVVRKKPIPRED
jgi:hypothetical protein